MLFRSNINAPALDINIVLGRIELSGNTFIISLYPVILDILSIIVIVLFPNTSLISPNKDNDIVYCNPTFIESFILPTKLFSLVLVNTLPKIIQLTAI